jgi:peptidyl-prolyl cis-trans isomerase D
VDEAQAMGADQILLARLTRDLALTAEAHALGLSASDEAVRDSILESPSFAGLDGKFDETQYKFVLDRLGIAVDKFERDQRNALAREQVALGVIGGAKAPSNLAREMLAYRLEKRKFVYLTLTPAAQAADPGAPDEGAVRAQYEATPEAYSSPEIRVVSYLAIDPARLSAGIEVSEEDLRGLYQDRAADYIIPERRVVDQLVYPSEAEARAALSLIESGAQDFAAAAAALDLTLDDATLGELTRNDLSASVAEAVFAGGLGVVGPVQTDFGPALMNVRAILAAKTTSFEDAREELRREYAGAEAQGAAIELADKAADLLARGETLSAIAGELGLTVATAEVRRDGEGLTGVAAAPEFIAEAFEAEVAEERDFLETAAGAFFLMRLDEVRPAAVRPLEEVRAQVVEDWRRARQTEDLAAKADAAVEALNGGEHLFVIADQYGLEQAESGDVNRGQAVGGLPRAIVEAMFAAEVGQAASSETPEGVVVAQLVSVTPADMVSADNARLLDVWSEALDASVGQDVYAYYGIALQNREGATVNPQALERVLNSFR